MWLLPRAGPFWLTSRVANSVSPAWEVDAFLEIHIFILKCIFVMIFMRTERRFPKTPKSSKHTIHLLLLIILPMIYAKRSEQNCISWLELIFAGFMFLLCQIKISHARPLLWPHLTTLTCWTHAFLWPQLLTSNRTAQIFLDKFIHPSFVPELMYFSI